MSKTFYFLLITALAVACNQQRSEETHSTIDSIKQLEPLSSEIESELESESTNVSEEIPAQKKQAAWDALPSEWQMITNENEEFIRFRPCDAAIPTVSIDKKNNKVYIGYGQDGDEMEIVSWEYSEEPFKDEVEYYYRFKVKAAYEDGSRELILNYNKKGVSGWSKVFASQGPTLFVHKAIAENYRLIEQPCVECWGDDCDEE